MEFGPMTIQKEDGVFYSYLLVENGPKLMNSDKNYTEIFNDIIDKFPSLENVAFYNKKYTTYKIKFKGRRKVVIDGLKNLLTEES